MVEILENDDIKKLTSLLVISLLLGSIFITFGCLEDGDTDNTPKSTLIEWFEKIDTKKGEEAMKLMASRYVDNESIKEQFEGMKRAISNGNYTVESFEILEIEGKIDMNQTEKKEMNKFASFCENYTDRDVESYCRIEFNMTGSFSGEEGEYTGETHLPLIEIEDDWYLANILYAYYLYVNLPTGHPPK